MSVIRHDFDTHNRGAARRPANVAEAEAPARGQYPGQSPPYLERASERLYQLEKILFEAVEMAITQTVTSAARQTISVSKADHQRYLACLAIIENGLVQLVAGDEGE